MTQSRALRDVVMSRVRGHAGVSLYGRQVNRRLGGVLARVAYGWGLRPNQVTTASGATSALAVAVLVMVRPSFVSGVAVWFLVALAYALDSADGQLARLRGGGTLCGEWFDHVLDAGRMVALHSGVLVMVYRFYGAGNALLVPLLYVFAASVMFAAGTLAEILLRDSRVGAPRPEPAPAVTLRALLLLPLDVGVLGLSFLLIAHESVFLSVYGTFLALTVLVGTALLVKWFSQLSAVSQNTLRDVASTTRV
jgi:phosphatidylglycerophosphate synthase